MWFSACRTLHKSKQCNRHLSAVLHRSELSKDANVGPIFSDGGGDVGSVRSDETGATHIMVTRPGNTVSRQLRQHGLSIGRPRLQHGLVYIRLRWDWTTDTGWALLTVLTSWSPRLVLCIDWLPNLFQSHINLFPGSILKKYVWVDILTSTYYRYTGDIASKLTDKPPENVFIFFYLFKFLYHIFFLLLPLRYETLLIIFIVYFLCVLGDYW